MSDIREKWIKIPGRLTSATKDSPVAGADEIWDDSLSKSQAELNQQIGTPISASGIEDGAVTSPKLAPRRYNSVAPDGLGYKILNPNSSFVSQVTDSNTTYEVQNVFDLDDGTVTMPADCTLKFTGGSIVNGELVLDNASIEADYACFDCDVTGTIKNDVCRSVWFNVEADDYTEGFRRLVRLANGSSTPIFFDRGEYKLTNLNDAEHPEDYTVVRVPCDFNNSTINFYVTVRHCQLKFSNGTKREIPTELNEYFAALVNDKATSLVKVTDDSEIKEQLKEYYGSYVQIGNPNAFLDSLPTTPVNDYANFDPNDYPGLEIVRHHNYNGNYQLRFQYEQFYVDEMGYVNEEPFNDSIGMNGDTFDPTSIVAYSLNAVRPIYVKNLNFNLYDTYSDGEVGSGSYRSVGIGVLDSLDVSFENIQFHAVETIPKGYRFIQINTGHNIVLNNVYADNTPITQPTSSSTYVFSLGRVVGLMLNNVRVPELVTSRWGATGCNYLTDLYVSNSSLSRIDCHYRVNNLTVIDSELGTYGVAVVGYGKIELIRCNFYGRYGIRIRADHGCFFDGDIIIKDCILKNNSLNKSCEMVRGLVDDFNYHCAATERIKVLVANNIYAENVKVEGTGIVSFFRTYTDSRTNDFSTDNQVRHLPNVTVKNLEMSTSDTITRGTYVYTRTVDDTYIVDPSTKMTLNIDGFKNNYVNVVTKAVGVLVSYTNVNNTTMNLVENYGYPLNVLANNVIYISTKIRGAVQDDVEPSQITYNYIKAKVDYTIANATVQTLQGPADNDAKMPVTYTFTDCLVKAYDNAEAKTKRIQMEFNGCLFDVSRTGNYTWYNKSGGKIFTNNPNISVINSRLTDALATALSLNTYYDDRLIPLTEVPSNPNVGDMCFQEGKPTWWNGTNWVDATGSVIE